MKWLKEHKKVLIYLAVGILLLILILWLFGKKIFGGKVANNPAVFPLGLNSKGAEVSNLQKFLNFSSNSDNLVVSGVFDAPTQSAVQAETGYSVVTQDYYNKFVVPYLQGIQNTGTTAQGAPISNFFTASYDDVSNGFGKFAGTV